jgi:hypothetical protein
MTELNTEKMLAGLNMLRNCVIVAERPDRDDSHALLDRLLTTFIENEEAVTVPDTLPHLVAMLGVAGKALGMYHAFTTIVPGDGGDQAKIQEMESSLLHAWAFVELIEKLYA